MVSWLPSTEKFRPVVLLEKVVISQHVVFIRESEGILLAIPFQLIGTGICGAAEKAGQHGVALDRALNGGILAENLAV